ncbi:aldehyde dehydrogenase [Melanomma pulvis-pyrius CBS 109.77]|uniref:Aldehyde dehydrogenase n=1 Tax=Melanomma pulvis-pyrius CBS 109.77 TaxID=1314802 RepID=A0A6A6WWP5_9PLEO|nr:aldehyde dehydrogenase [Melanomma pulvis-pyrius CBS 109.77]
MYSHGESTVPLWIDNEPVRSDITFTVTNQGTNRSISAYGASTEDVKRAICTKLLEEHRDEVAQILKVETPVDDFVAQQINIQSSIDLLQELAAQVLQTTGGTLLPSKQGANTLIVVVKEPLGVQLGVAPWNVSLFLGLRAVATPIACGNTAILKASEITPLVHNFIGVLFRDAGFPPGVLNVIQHSRDDAPAVLDVLIRDDRVRKVNFTGSTAVGKIIAAKAAEFCKPVLLELGGKAPQIVLEDADLDKAAQAAVIGAFSHHGQICMSTERIIVSEVVRDKFAEKLCDYAPKFKVLSGASSEHITKVVELVRGAMDHGAELLYGRDLQRQGSYLSPLILTKVTRDLPIWRTETFAPIALLISFSTLDEAIELANDCAYGLSASIFTSNVPRGIELARRLDCGAVNINSMTIHDEVHLPHGGTKSSGWGRFGIPWGFAEFTQLKTITVTDENFRGLPGS